jgi:3-oxoacyl-(acyl-carrier-protein) synthase
LIDKKSARRYDDCLKYTMVAGKKALAQAGLDKDKNASAFSQLDLTRCGVLVGSGMGGLTVFQDGKQHGGLIYFHSNNKPKTEQRNITKKAKLVR